MLAISAQVQQTVRDRWLAATIETYPGPIGDFLVRERDPFRNPIGHSLRAGLPVLLEELFGCMNTAIFTPALSDIVRIRAVQDFTPSQAVGFLFLLKGILRREITGPPDQLRELEDRIDELVRVGFDLFMEYREKIYALKAGEARRRTDVLERIHLGTPER